MPTKLHHSLSPTGNALVGPAERMTDALSCVKSRMGSYGLAAILAMAFALPSGSLAESRSYPVDSLIIPMETTYQDRGIFKAYGLVYKLLSSGVPVDWTIKPGKHLSAISAATASGTTATFTTTTPHDLSAGDAVRITGVIVSGYNGSWTVSSVVSATQFTVTLNTSGLGPANQGTVAPAEFIGSATDIASSATITNHAYLGGPFVIDAASRAAALPIIQAWQTANPGNVIAVHAATAPFTSTLGRALVAAPRLAVFDDGNSDIAFSYLNAAGIPDEAGNSWTLSSINLLTQTAVAGSTTSNHRDGALFDSKGVPQYSALLSMHYRMSDAIVFPGSEAVAEVGEFLKSRVLLFAQCQAAFAFENNGRFLTDQGLSVMGQPASNTVVAFFADQPVAQDEGPFGTVGGSEPAFKPTGIYNGIEGNTYFRILRGFNAPASSLDREIVLLGYAYQNTSAGRVVYMGGHQYPVAIPLSGNPQSHGVRYFLNALLAAPATATGMALAI